MTSFDITPPKITLRQHQQHQDNIKASKVKSSHAK